MKGAPREPPVDEGVAGMPSVEEGVAGEEVLGEMVVVEGEEGHQSASHKHLSKKI